MLTIGSLFSGIGGLDLGLERAGLGPVLWQVERDAFCQRVLSRHWPDVERFDDVKSVSAAELVPVDLICGGFPCQDVSSAGKGAGLTGERSGLWREFARVVGDIKPSWVVVENVASGAPLWVDQVSSELEQLGYEALPVPVSAFDVGAPHMRKRVFIVAHAADFGLKVSRASGLGQDHSQASGCCEIRSQCSTLLANGNGRGQHGENGCPGQESRVRHAGRVREEWPPSPDADWGSWDGPEPALRREANGFPCGMARREWAHRLRALGNAVVPQCAEVVGWVVRELAGLVDE